MWHEAQSELWVWGAEGGTPWQVPQLEAAGLVQVGV